MHIIRKARKEERQRWCNKRSNIHKLKNGKSLKESTKEIENVRVEFCDNFSKNIEDRFPIDAISVATAFSVLNETSLS